MAKSNSIYRSRLWYLLPIFLHLVGGVIGYFLIRRSNSALAKKVLGLGIIFTAAMAIVAIYPVLTFQADRAIAHERISRGNQLVNTANGTLEYADVGIGDPVLVLHGAGGGYDQGLLLSEIFLLQDNDQYRTIVPSRFGFLQTPLPDAINNQKSSIAAQADAYADLLNMLDIEKVAVIGFSAGGPSSIEFTLRHPDKVSELVLISAVIHKEPAMQPSEDITYHGVFKSDFAFWLMGKYFQSQMLSFLGVSLDAQATLTPEDKTWISDTFMPSMNPISPRQQGMLNDRVNSISINYSLAEIAVPTLIVNAKDDTLVNPSHSQYAAVNVPNAKHIEFDDGGHVLLGHHHETRAAVTDFLAS